MRRRPPPYNSLPFIHYPKKLSKASERHYWAVAPAENYSQACADGYQYAFRFIKFLRDYPDEVVETNLLGDIAACIDFNDPSDNKGYHIGFFSYLERVLYQQTKDMNFEAEWLALLSELNGLQRSDG